MRKFLRNPLSNQHGVAIVMTLMVITLLLSVGFELHRRTRSELGVLAAVSNRCAASRMAASGVHAAIALLANEEKKDDVVSLRDDWADEELLKRIANVLSFKRGKVFIRIEDEKSRIQVNALIRFPDRHTQNDDQMFLLDRFLKHFTKTRDDIEIDSRTVVNSLKDWIDAGDDDAVTGLTGAESDYYMGFDPPYSCRNGPVPNIADLARVKGLDPMIVFGDRDSLGMERYLTVHGTSNPASKKPLVFDGKININTADRLVISAMLPTGMEAIAGAICDYRDEMQGAEYTNDISYPAWYRDVPGFGLIDEEGVKRFEALVTLSSELFRITARSETDGPDIQIVAVVRRVKETQNGRWKIRILSWQET